MRKLAIAALVCALGVGALGQVTISFWHAMSGALGTTLTELIDKFHAENPGIRVDLIYQGGYGTLQQKLTAAVAAGQPPTIAQQYENWTTGWLDALVDLDLFVSEAILNDLLPQFDQRFEGRLVTVPFNKSILVLYYRPDLVPNPQDVGGVRGGGGPDREGRGQGGLRNGVPTAEPRDLPHPSPPGGGSILSADWSQTTINNAEGLAAAEFAARLAQYALVQSAYISDAIQKGIAIGMFIDTSAGYTYNMNAAKTAGVPLAVAPLPCNVNCASMIQGTNLAIFAPNQSRAQIQAAAKLIEFLLREDNIVYWAQKTGYLPVTRTAIQGQLWQGYIAGKPEQKVMTDQLIAGGFGQLLHPRYMDMRSLLITYWELLLKGEGTPKAILDALAAEIEAVRK